MYRQTGSNRRDTHAKNHRGTPHRFGHRLRRSERGRGAAEADAYTNWRPLINTPPYPDYSSGANGVSWAAMRALKLFFGTDHFTFSVRSTHTAANPPTRPYTRFSDAGEEVLEARILQGIHLRFADEAGAKQGRKVASYVFKHALLPVGALPDDGDEGDEEEEEE